jgi:ribonuclease P protein component
VLFKERRSIKFYPYLIIYKFISKRPSPLLFGVSVSKRNFKKAVDRNRIKRMTREAYRTQKSPLVETLSDKNSTLAMMFLYIGRENIEYAELNKAINKAIRKLQSLA